jgi:hypothetical protein
MMILGPKRDKLIDNLNLSVPLKKLTKGEYVHDELEFRCLELKYSLEPADFSPRELKLVPLWESDISITGFYLNGDDTVFIHYYIEDITDFKKIGSSVDELVDYLVREYVDYDYEDEVRGLLLEN